MTCSNTCIYAEWFGKTSTDLYFSCTRMVALQLLARCLGRDVTFLSSFCTCAFSPPSQSHGMTANLECVVFVAYLVVIDM